MQVQEKITHNFMVFVAGLSVISFLAAFVPDSFIFSIGPDYLPIHTGLEQLSIVMSSMIFGLGVSLRAQPGNNHLVVMATGLMAVSVIDLAHTLSFYGMPDFVTKNGPDKAIHYWLAARSVAALSILYLAIAPVRTWSKGTANGVILAGLALAIIIFALPLVYEQSLLRTFVPGQGLTPLKIGAEYVLMIAYGLSAFLLAVRKRSHPNYSRGWLAAAAWVLCLSESFFTLYTNVTDLYNLLGHLYKVAGYLLIYRAIFVEGVRAPYRQLAQERHYLHLVIDQAPDGIVIYDPSAHRIVQANPAAEALFGRSEKELQQVDNLLDLYAPHPDEAAPREAFRSAVQRALLGERVFAERRVIGPQGRIRLCEVRTVAVTIAGRHLIRASYLDVTERRQAEVARQESENRLAGIVNSAMDGIICLDDDFNVVVFNPAAATIFGIRPQEVLGKPIDRFIPEGLRSSHAGLIRSFASSDVEEARRMGQSRQVTAVRANSVEFPIEASISKFEANGKVGLTVIVRDLTEKLSMSRKLQHAQKMEALGHLTGGLAHDFNNILGVIKGGLQLLEESFPPGSKEVRLVQSAIRASDRGAGLVNSLLAFARRQPLAPVTVDLAQVVRGSTEMLEIALGSNVSVSLDIRSKAQVSIDVSQFESAILNLIVNARDAMPDGGELFIRLDDHTLTLRDELLDLEPGHYVEVAVMDTGMGMSDDVIAQVFDPFFTTKQGRGSGLGLSMVHGFVQQSNGRIRIESEPGQGTTVIMYFPTVSGDEARSGEGR